MTGRDAAWLADLAGTLAEVDEFLRTPAGHAALEGFYQARGSLAPGFEAGNLIDAVLPGAEDPHLGGVYDADEEPGISGGVMGKVPAHVGEVPDSRQVFGGDCCLRAGGSRERRGRISRLGPWSAADRGSAR